MASISEQLWELGTIYYVLVGISIAGGLFLFVEFFIKTLFMEYALYIGLGLIFSGMLVFTIADEYSLRKLGL